ncbi:Tc5 transposase DNA-binding domain [Popillia japonica]|uniref:Tc5 transposase DNA-binding domain n=1 Tax=Popillia japonica TaxID=7064 RepID=A0AAW1NLZ3_POPJA
MCYDWFPKARSQKVPISAPIVKAKAKEIAQQMEYSAFSASDGWLQIWSKRHNITFRHTSGDAADESQIDVDQFKAKLPSILLGHPPENIYNPK